MDKEMQMEQESELLAQSVKDVIASNEILIHMVAKFINETECLDEDVRRDLQRAYALFSQGKKGLRQIGFLETVN